MIRPSLWDKAVAILFLLFAGLFWVTLLKTLLAHKLPSLANLTGLLFVDLFKFGISDRKLSTIIEYYKTAFYKQ